MADLSETVSNALVRVARTADEIRNGLALATAHGNVRLDDPGRPGGGSPKR